MRHLVVMACATLAACSAAGGAADGTTSEEPAGVTGAGGGASVASAASGGDAAGTGAGSPVCAPFATGPLGVEVGDVLDPDVVLRGFVEGATGTSTLRLGDLRDCDGSTGVDAVLLIAARSSCSKCRQDAETLAEEADGWAASGVRTVVLMLSGDVEAWRDVYGLERVAVLEDPGRTLDLPEPPPEPSGGFQRTVNGTPLYVVLDPRTGRVHERHLGSDWDDAELLALAAGNAR